MMTRYTSDAIYSASWNECDLQNKRSGVLPLGGGASRHVATAPVPVVGICVVVIAAINEVLWRCARSTPVRPPTQQRRLRRTRLLRRIRGMCNVWTARPSDPLGAPHHQFAPARLDGERPADGPGDAPVAYADRQVVSVSGDGGLSMLLGRLITANVPPCPSRWLSSLLAGHEGEAGDAGQRRPGLQTDVRLQYAIARAVASTRARVEMRLAWRRVPKTFAAPGSLDRGHIHGPERPLPLPAITGPGRRFRDRDESKRPQPVAS